MVTVTIDQLLPPPTDIQATRSKGSLTLTWSAPPDSGTPTITTYKIRWKQSENAGETAAENAAALDAAEWNVEEGVDTDTDTTHSIPTSQPRPL